MRHHALTTARSTGGARRGRQSSRCCRRWWCTRQLRTGGTGGGGAGVEGVDRELQRWATCHSARRTWAAVEVPPRDVDGGDVEELVHRPQRTGHRVRHVVRTAARHAVALACVEWHGSSGTAAGGRVWRTHRRKRGCHPPAHERQTAPSAARRSVTTNRTAGPTRWALSSCGGANQQVCVEMHCHLVSVSHPLHTSSG